MDLKETTLKVENVSIDFLYERIMEYLTANGYATKNKDIHEDYFEISLDIPIEIKQYEGIAESADIICVKSNNELTLNLKIGSEKTDMDNNMNELDIIHEKWRAWRLESHLKEAIIGIVKNAEGIHSNLKNLSEHQSDPNEMTVCPYCGYSIHKESQVCPNCGHSFFKDGKWKWVP
ncbi:MAG: zinc ribbon domain-containing protein [Thermoplasmata archaeon]